MCGGRVKQKVPKARSILYRRETTDNDGFVIGLVICVFPRLTLSSPGLT